MASLVQHSVLTLASQLPMEFSQMGMNTSNLLATGMQRCTAFGSGENTGGTIKSFHDRGKI